MIRILEGENKPISISASELGAMSKDDRVAWLDEAPVGSTITGLLYADSGREAIVRKEAGYSAIYGGIGAGSRLYDEYWCIAGYKEPYISSMIKKAYDGTSKYYKV